MASLLSIRGLAKGFTLHLQQSARIDVFEGFDLDLEAGESLGIAGPSGKGKSSLLKLIYGTYKAAGGEILVSHQGGMLDMVTAAPREILDVRRHTIGFVTQFLRVIPRVAAIDVVAEPLLERGVAPDVARARAAELLSRLRIAERLWPLPPMTFSGGEQQRVNIARGFAAEYPILLLDEPTASLDATNRAAVLELVREAQGRGTALVSIFHDEAERVLVCSRSVNL
ncbi:MAG: phosphonate C-P lyase system protein PhnL [Aestuariivirgaceae bacterium]|nr:phosphonate C-P lyase system protein PhnL [Aestuariivirgaceae bacterium]